MKQVIEGTKYPRTKQSIVADLRKMGVERGMTILVHSSLSRIGWVNGGATAVIQALMEVVTEEGTIVMPSQSVELSDPARWEIPLYQNPGGRLLKKACRHMTLDIHLLLVHWGK